MKDDIFKNITDYYENITYFTKYFKDILFAFTAIVIVLLIIIYFYIKIRIEAIRKEWPSQRCNPIYIPFAGLIHKIDGHSTLESGQINFMYCQSNILNSIANKFFNPLDYLLKLISSIFNKLVTALNYIRNLIQYLKRRILEITKPILIKIIEILNPLIIIIIYIKDIFAKAVGIAKATILSIIAYMYTVISTILNFYKIVRAMMLLSLAGTIALWATFIILSFIPIFGWIASAPVLIAAIAATATTLVFIVFTIILSSLTKQLFKKVNKPYRGPAIPNTDRDVAEMKAKEEKAKQRKEERERRIRERRERREARYRARMARREARRNR